MSATLIFFLLCCLLIGIFLLFVRKRHNHWKNRGIPSTRPNILFGDFKQFVFGTKHQANIVDDIYKKFSDERYVGMYQLHVPVLLIRDPALIGAVFVNDFAKFHDRFMKSDFETTTGKLNYNLFFITGNTWHSIRSKMIPAFSSSKLSSMYNLMEYCITILDKQMKSYCAIGELVDVRELMARFTTDVIGCCAFGLECDALTNKESEYRRIGKRVFMPTLRNFSLNMLRFFSPTLRRLIKISEQAPEVESFFFNLLKGAEELRKRDSNRRTDLLQLMLDIKERDATVDVFKKDDEKEVLFDDVIVAANMFLIYAAGFETTASTLSYCLYELALNPEIQDKLRSEIIKVKNNNDGAITYATLKELTYMEMVLSETLRMYNPFGLLQRTCTKTYQIPHSNVVLKPGDRVMIPVHAVHHDEKYHPNPYKFDPERFSEENLKKQTPNTFFPFGDGPRMCLGVRFAKMEMKACLSFLLLKYRFYKCDKTEIPIKVDPRALVYSPKRGIILRATEIKDDDV